MNYKEKIAIAVLFIAYIILSLFYITKQGFWHDEVHTLTFLKGISAYDFYNSSLSNIHGIFTSDYCKELYSQDYFIKNFYLRILHEGHPPLYFLLLKVWALMIGYNELSLRSFSLFCGLLAILILYLHVRSKHNKLISISALLLLLFNPMLFYYFAEARMYATAFLFATIAFVYWSKYQVSFKTLDFYLFCLFSIMLFYTHYYGVFFIATLIFFDLINSGFQRRFYKYLIPFLFFLPWFFIIIQQINLHTIHWTNGSLSFIDSFTGYFNGLINLGFSPMANHNYIEGLTALILLILAIIILKGKIMKYLAATLFLFIVLYLFDLITDHHTIIISRYYMSYIIILIWMMVDSLSVMPKKYILVFTVIYCLVSGVVLLDIYHLRRAPKQMYRELAFYVSSKHSPDNTLLVIEPKSASIWGISYYLPKEYKIISAKDLNFSKMKLQAGYKVIFVDENLGDFYNESKFNDQEQQQLNKVDFVGISLYE